MTIGETPPAPPSTEQDALLAAVVRTTRQPFAVLDSALTVQYASPALLALFRSAPAAIVGKPFFSLGCRQWDIPVLRQLFAEILTQRREVRDFRVEADFPVVGQRSLLVNACYLDDGADQAHRLLVALDDVTERERLQREALARGMFSDQVIDGLREAQRRFQLFMDNSPAIAWIKDEDGRHIYLSGAYERRFGVRLEDWLGKTDAELWPPEVAAAFRRNDAEVLASGRTLQFEEDAVEPDGRRSCWLNAKFLLRDEEGRRYVAGIGVDISARKQAESELLVLKQQLQEQVERQSMSLQAERDFIETILDNEPVLVLVLDADGRIVRFNRACEEATGYRFSELVGTTGWLDLVPAEEREGIRELVSALNSGRSPATHENHWRHRDGTSRLYSWTNVLLREDDGRIRYMIGAGVDITELREAERVAQERLDEIAHYQRLQLVEVLTSAIAHEVNQPLGAIAAFADASLQMMQGPAADPAILAGNMKMIRRQALRASETIRRIRHFASRGDLKRVSLDLNAVVRDAVQLFQQQAKTRGLHVALHLAEDLPPVAGVALQIEQVLLNLLRNAMEAMSDAQTGAARRRIEIRTRLAGAAACVTVRDSGPGVAPSAVEKIFEPLASTKSQGLGLGLRISRAIVEGLGGRLWVEPQQPGGIFHFEIPLAT